MNRIAAIAAALVLIVGSSSANAAQPQDVANDIADEVMSPFCPGVTLLECPSAQAYQLRERILAWVKKGWSSERVMDGLEQQFGPGIRAAPPRSGSGLVAWIVPALAVAAGLCAMLLVRRRATTHRPPDEVSGEPVSPEERLRLAAELDAVRKQSW
jgi:cytochrome c-type biogenesis protein CcmH